MAKFVLICGPQAVGKMTVGQELAKLTGLKFMHNHETIDLPLKFFEFKMHRTPVPPSWRSRFPAAVDVPHTVVSSKSSRVPKDRPTRRYAMHCLSMSSAAPTPTHMWTCEKTTFPWHMRLRFPRFLKTSCST